MGQLPVRGKLTQGAVIRITVSILLNLTFQHIFVNIVCKQLHLHIRLSQKKHALHTDLNSENMDER